MKPETQPGASPCATPLAPSDAIDRILISDEPLVPSSGFAASVMDRIREESAAPPPIPFPWRRALPGMTVVVLILGWLIYKFAGEFLRTAWAEAVPGAITGPFVVPHFSAATQQALAPTVWVALALLVSLASWAFARRLTRRSSLL